MLKRLIEWIKSLFKKTTTSWTAKPETGTPVPNVGINLPDPPQDNEAQYNAWRAQQPVGLQAYIPTWAVKQERDRRVREAAATPGRDRIGGNLNDGMVHVNQIADGAAMTYTFTVSPGMEFVKLVTHSHSNSGFARKEFTVTGPLNFSGAASGSEGQNAGPPIIHQNLPPGDYTVVVRYFGVYGGAIAAQVVRNPTQPHDHPGYTHY